MIDPAERAVALGVGISVVLGAVAGLILKHRDEVTIRVALSVFGAVYLGVPLGFFVATRELPTRRGRGRQRPCRDLGVRHVLVLRGEDVGNAPIAPRTSPNKTVEGFIGGLVGGTVAVWVAGLYMDWIGLLESLVLGLILCAFAYTGDLFESMIKRDIDVKDSGRLLGAHGGVLDRFDALLFAAVGRVLRHDLAGVGVSAAERRRPGVRSTDAIRFRSIARAQASSRMGQRASSSRWRANLMFAGLLAIALTGCRPGIGSAGCGGGFVSVIGQTPRHGRGRRSASTAVVTVVHEPSMP